MRNITLASAALAAAALLAGATATSASASASAEDTTVTTIVEGGVLSLSAPTTGVALTAKPGATATAALGGDVVVTDETADLEGWTATISIATDFASASTGTSIPAAGFTYAPTTAVVTGTAVVSKTTVTGTDGVVGVAASAVQAATAVTGNNTATWQAELSLVIPSDALGASDYVAVLTHSVS